MVYTNIFHRCKHSWQGLNKVNPRWFLSGDIPLIINSYYYYLSCVSFISPISPIFPRMQQTMPIDPCRVLRTRSWLSRERMRHGSYLSGPRRLVSLSCFVGPMLVKCWAIVFDAGPALNQHWHYRASMDSGLQSAQRCYTENRLILVSVKSLEFIAGYYLIIHKMDITYFTN